MNNPPVKPDVACPAPDTEYDTYHTDLQSNLNVSRKDKFLLIMDIPNILKPYIRNDSSGCNMMELDRLQMNIWGHVVPEIKKPKIDVKWGGQTAKFSSFSTETYSTITVNFTIDNRFDNYFILYEWLNLQNDQELSIFDGKRLSNKGQSGFIDDYSTTIRVYALDEYDKPVLEVIYNNAFPTALGAINANHKDNTENDSTFSFDFSTIKIKRTHEFIRP